METLATIHVTTSYYKHASEQFYCQALVYILVYILLFSPMSFIGIRFCALLLFLGHLAEREYFTNQIFSKPLTDSRIINLY